MECLYHNVIPNCDGIFEGDRRYFVIYYGANIFRDARNFISFALDYLVHIIDVDCVMKGFQNY